MPLHDSRAQPSRGTRLSRSGRRKGTPLRRSGRRKGTPLRRSGRRSRAKELLPESLKRPKRYSVPDPPHGVKVEAQIVQRVKGGRGHFPGHVQMTEIGSRMAPAGVAPAGRIDRRLVVRVAGVLDVDPALTGEQ